MRLSIVFIFLLWIYPANAQSVKKEAFEKAVDYLNCKLVERSLQISPARGVLNSFKEKCKCDQYPDFETIHSSIPSSESEIIGLSREIDNIKREYRSGMEFEKALNFLSDEIFKDENRKKIHNLAKASEKNLQKHKAFVQDLKDNVSKILKASLSQASPQESERVAKKESPQESERVAKKDESRFELESRLEQLESRIKDLESRDGWFKGVTFEIDAFALLLSLALFGSLIFLFFQSLKSFRTSLEGEELKAIREDVERRVSPFNEALSRLNFIESEYRRLKSDLQSLKAPAFSQQSVQPTFVQPTSTNLSPPSASNASIEKKVLYFSVPNPDGTFSASSASQTYQENRSIYKFFLDASASKAEFKIDDENDYSAKLAIYYSDKIIDPVCESENEFSFNARRISTTRLGKAELSGDKWIVKTKARIRYEY